MKTVTIYRISETDRTIDIAQSVNDDSESIKAAVLNTKNFTFDEILRQHLAFRDSGTLIENCLNRFLSALHIGRGVPVNADDMLAGFTAENESWFCSQSDFAVINDRPLVLLDKTPRSYGENIFLRGMMTAAHELYDVERKALSTPNDVLLATLNKSRIQAEISAKINTFLTVISGLSAARHILTALRRLTPFQLYLPKRLFSAMTTYSARFSYAIIV